MSAEEIEKEEKSSPEVLCIFSVKELDLIAESLMHLHLSNVDYLEWKKDEFSQVEIPKKMERILQVYHKVHKSRS